MTRSVRLLARSLVTLAASLSSLLACGGEPAPSELDPREATSPSTTRALPPPRTLRETDLYADWATKTIADGVLSFSPQYPLWTDGAEKRRFIALPRGTWIDAGDPDAWRFPIGTRIWKEFSFGRRVETRYMQLGPDGWAYATYVWSEDEREAILADERGVNVAIDAGATIGARHAIPSASDCVACHGQADTPVLGFSLLQLSPDRDPLAPHAAPRSSDDVDLPALVARGLLRNLPAALLTTPPRVVARTPIERAALGYLHGNCGGCHRSTGALAELGMRLAHEHDAAIEPAVTTTIEVASGFSLGDDPTPLRVAPGRPEASVLIARMRSRDPYTQMPPIGTYVVDDEAARLVTRWIEELPPPSPGERP